MLPPDDEKESPVRRRLDANDLVRWSRRNGDAVSSLMQEEVRVQAAARLAGGPPTRLGAQRAGRILTRLERSVVCPDFATSLAGRMGRDLRRLQQSVLALEAGLDLADSPPAPDLAPLLDACLDGAAAMRAHRMVADLLDLPRILEVAAGAAMGRTQAWALARSARTLAVRPGEASLARLLIPRYRRLVAHDAATFRLGSLPRLTFGKRPGDGAPPAHPAPRRSTEGDAANASVEWVLRELSWSAARAAVQAAAPATLPSLKTAVHVREERRRIRRLGRTRALLDLIQACGMHLPVAAAWERRAVRALQRAARQAGMAPAATSYDALRERIKGPR